MGILYFEMSLSKSKILKGFGGKQSDLDLANLHKREFADQCCKWRKSAEGQVAGFRKQQDHLALEQLFSICGSLTLSQGSLRYLYYYSKQ